MANQLYRPSIDELEALRALATKNGSVTESEWCAKNVEIQAGFIRQDPLRYRSFGPYWWILKRAMLKHGIDDFGDFIDSEWESLCDYGTEFHNLLAAWMYAENALDMGLIYSNAHTVAFEPEEADMERDIRPYQLVDDDMEIYAQENRFVR